MSKIPIWIFENLHEIIRDLENNYMLYYTNTGTEERKIEDIINKLNNCKHALHDFEDQHSKDNIGD